MRLEEVVAMPCESARFGGERGEVGGRGAKLKGGGGGLYRHGVLGA